MRIYNSITRKKEEFIPVIPGQVGIYVCGPTVYGPATLGHARTYTNFDVIVRAFRFLGYKVKYVQNITDVGHLVGDADEGEDKIAKRAKLEQLDPYEVAYKWELEYFNAMRALNIEPPSISCRATGVIPEIIEMVQTLIDKGFAYATPQGNVYFSIRKYPKYNQLTNRKIEEALSGERIEIADDKQAPEDFALWKKAEPEHLMRWNSPWGVGFPGWHVECSAMGKKFLGDNFDIHGGGLDNIFPHHECELAQGECANGVLPMNYFMHNNLLTVDGVKMGKSLGNFITIAKALEDNSASTLRLFIIQFHYRSPIDFTNDGLVQAAKQFDKIASAVAKVRGKTNEIAELKSEITSDIFAKIKVALEDDFNTPVVISEVLHAVKEINKTDDIQLLKEFNYIIQKIFEEVLGFEFEVQTEKVAHENVVPDNILELAEQRWQAKQGRDFARADELRKQLDEIGYVIVDEKGSYKVEKK